VIRRNNSKSNIVMVVLDTAAAKHFSLYGYSRATTPNMERISRSAAVYTRCFSPAPWTLPAHASLFTGLYPSQHMNDGTRLTISRNFYTLPEILREAGYRTCGISANTIITHDFCGGFEAFHEAFHFLKETKEMKDIQINYFLKADPFMILPYAESKRDVVEQMMSLPIERLSTAQKMKIVLKAFGKTIGNGKRFGDFTKVLLNLAFRKRNNVVYDATPSTLRALKVAAKQLRRFSRAKEPFFLFVNFMQLHDRYNPPPDTRNSFVRENKEYDSVGCDMLEHYAVAPFAEDFLRYLEARYDEELLFLDGIVGQIDAFLHELHLVDNTMFVITSDHGETFGEHGHVQHLFSTCNELIHVPLIIRYPGTIKAAGQDTSLVQLHDLFATINDMAGAVFPSPQSSVSLLGSRKRDAAISQLLDVTHKLVACKIKNNRFDMDHFDFKDPEISVITDDMHKVTQRGCNYECYNLSGGLYKTENREKGKKGERRYKKLMSLIERAKQDTGYYEALGYERISG